MSSAATLERRGDRGARVVRAALLALAMLAAIVPLIYVVRIGLQPPDDFTADPLGTKSGFTLSNFGRAWGDGGVGHSFINSVSIVPIGALLATAIGTCAGFALSKLPVPGGKAVFAGIAIAIAIPLPAIALPLFSEASSLGIANQRLGLSLIYGGIFSAWATIFMRGYFQDFPETLLEAARIDGCSYVRVFAFIVLPLAVPAIAAVFVVNLFIQWGELLLALIMLPNPSQHTVSVTVGSLATDLVGAGPVTAAAAVLAALPVIAVFLASQGFLQTGMRSGAVKG